MSFINLQLIEIGYSVKISIYDYCGLDGERGGDVDIKKNFHLLNFYCKNGF